MRWSRGADAPKRGTDAPERGAYPAPAVGRVWKRIFGCRYQATFQAPLCNEMPGSPVYPSTEPVHFRVQR